MLSSYTLHEQVRVPLARTVALKYKSMIFFIYDIYNDMLTSNLVN